jgi:glycosyltransferase involved in cell wall biosynthesis
VCHQSRALVGAGVCASCNALQRAYRLLRLEWRSLTSLIRLPAVLRIALYNLHFATLGGGERRTALLATHLARAHDVALFSAAPIDAAKISHLFDIDVSAVQNIVLPPDESQHAHSIAAWRPDLFINNSHASRLPCPAKRGIYMCMFPERGADPVGGYQVVTANSSFTREWIAKLWSRKAEVVYSAVESMGPPAAKRNIILNVARFQADVGDNHFKHQDLLLEVFQRGQAEIGASWEMHFVGTIGDQPGDRPYAESLLQRARGTRTHFHFGMPQDELRELYRSASLYWHATGCSDGQSGNPSRQEHFGMTILEAMSAGAIPIAFRGGGPCETIVHGASGFLWRRPEEIMEHTRYLLRNPMLCRALSKQCVERSRNFDKAEYLRRMDSIVAGMLAS